MARVLRRSVGFALVAAVIGSLFGAIAPAGAAGGKTPPNEVLVVTANIEEAYTMPPGNDLADHFEIDNFAARVKQVVPEIPDVVLLQEVNRKTSALAASRLSARLNQKFVVAVQPIANTTIEYPDKQVHTETAILLNSKTMATANKGGYFAASYPKSAAASGWRVQVRRHAYMLARERGTGLKVPLVSLHFAMEKSFRTAKLSNYWRGRWAGQIETLLARKYNADSGARAAVVAGDFNQSRCVSGGYEDCKQSAYWNVFLGKPHAYVESSHELLIRTGGVDASFTAGRVLRAGWDRDGKFREGDRARFYSDHRLRWAVVGPKKT